MTFPRGTCMGDDNMDDYLRLFAEIRWILRKTRYNDQVKFSKIRETIDKIDKSRTLLEQEKISETEEIENLHEKYK